MGVKRPGANRPGAKCLGGELDLGRNNPDSYALALFQSTTAYKIDSEHTRDYTKLEYYKL